MATNTKVTITELDFDTIKTNLKTYLKQQTTFQDYDFEGSGLSNLLDVLAYNTHYMSYYANMIANEMFLDSAMIRSSVVSLAKHLGYMPTSFVSPTAIVNVTINNVSGSPASIILATGTEFRTTIDDVNYTFVPLIDTVITPVSGVYSTTGLTLREGHYLSYSHIINTADTTQELIIPNNQVDTSTLTIKVQTSVTDTTVETYTLADNINEIKATSTVYWLEEVSGQRYRVYFGDDVIGKKLVDGNVVIITYLSTTGSAANTASTFTLAGVVGGSTDATITTTTAAAGGSNGVSIDTIRFQAPKTYAAQNRCVTVQDYRDIISKEDPNIQTVAVWGGEDNVPPSYGKVYIAIKPKTGYVYSDAAKEAIKTSILKKKNVVTVSPEIVDPSYLYLVITSAVSYDKTKTTKSATTLQALTKATIEAYNDNNLELFDKYFRYSKLISNIDETDTSISNNWTTIKMKKIYTPTLNTVTQDTIYFNNAITPGTINTTGFTLSGTDTTTFYFDDPDTVTTDTNYQKLRQYSLVANVRTEINSNAGTIDYSAGTIQFNNLTFASSIDTDGIKITATPTINDVIPKRNDILVIDDADITVTVTEDTALTSGTT